MGKQEIIALLKTEGIEIGEDVAMAAAKGAIKLLRVLVPQLSRGFGLAFNLFLDAYEDKIYDMLDQIDGKKDR